MLHLKKGVEISPSFLNSLMENLNLENLAYLPDSQLIQYCSKDTNNRIKIGDYVINTGNYGDSLFKVIHITKGSVILSWGQNTIRENYNSKTRAIANSNWKVVTEELLFNKLREIREERFKKLLNKSGMRRYERFIKIVLSSIMSEDNYEINFTNDNILKIILRFPKLMLTSENGLTHTIRDMFVQIPIEYLNNTMRLMPLSYTRTTYTVPEVLNDYVHSHLNSNPFRGFSTSFCYGNTQFSSFINISSIKFDIKNLYIFIQNLIDFLKWESISGTPYNYISNLSGSSNMGINGTNVHLEIDVVLAISHKLYSDLIHSMDFSKIKADLHQENVQFSSESLDYIRGCIQELCPAEFKFKRNASGTSVSFDSSNTVIRLISRNGSESHVNFKGENIPYKILGLDEYLKNKEKDDGLTHHHIEGTILNRLAKEFKEILIEERYELV